MKIKTVAMIALLALVLTGCTSGRPDAAPGNAAAGGTVSLTGGVPEVVQPLEVRQLVHDTMKDKRIAFIPLLYKGYKITTEWGVQLQRGFESLGSTFTVYDSNFDTDQMVRIIDDLIKSKKADALILHNPDLNVLTQQIKEAQAAGIYVVVLNMTSNQSGDVFIGADLVSMAEEITNKAAVDCKADGKNQIALINGPATDPWNVLYEEGVKTAAEEQGLEIVDTTDSKWQADLASQQAATMIERHGADLCALMVPWDVVALPAGNAVKTAEDEGRVAKDQVGVYAIDSSSDGCEGISDGLIRASIAYDQSGIGTGALLAVQQLFELGNAPGSQRSVAYVPYVVIDKTNMSQVTFACYFGS
ncbi:sugar ABC transporter substrate-binding protein [Cryobacterium aureum]|uniref:sugar ABC transporter substrate-binding protein n=1 Tax=Cryobacterium aureum TaxID=995037 RepID=UPI000CF56D5F|nr:sugar ABC transporter substrate-binding protein [Cryobacterium aureum]